jgi:large subunit ribosomal protein L10
MPNLINEAITAEYEAVFGDELDTLVLQPVGMSVEEVNAFRGKLGDAGLRMLVVKSSLARRAFAARGLAADELFDGPSACVLPTVDDIEVVAITAARVVAAWHKETGKDMPAVKGGVLDGEVIASGRAAGLSKLPTKPDLQARISGQLLAPASRLSSQLRAAGGRIAGCIQTRITNLEDAG